MQAASCPTAYINQVMQPVTDVTRASIEHGRVPYVIPGLRQAVVALRHVAWWSQVTRTREPGTQSPNSAGARTVPAPGGMVGARRPAAAQRRGHPGRPGPPGPLGGRGGQGGRGHRRTLVGQDRLRGHPAQERHRRRPARRPGRRGRRPRRLPGRDRGRRPNGRRRQRRRRPDQPDAPRWHRIAGRRGPRPAVGSGPGRGGRRHLRRGAAGLGARPAAGHAGAGRRPARPTARPGGADRCPRRRTRRSRRPGRGDRPGRRSRRGPGR